MTGPHISAILEYSNISRGVCVVDSHQPPDAAKIKDLLFETNKSMAEIAKELGITVPELNRKVKDLGLEWVKRRHRKLSRGHSALYKLLQNLFPGERVVLEHHIGERLRLDIFVPAYNLAVEFHGRQHFEFVEHFHGTIYEFRASQERDQRKMELCKEQGIALVVFRYNDKLNEESVFARILDAARSREPVMTE